MPTPSHAAPQDHPTPRPGDPLRSLLRAACRAARHLDEGRATRVVVFVNEKKVIDLAVPDSVADGELRVPEAQAVPEDPPPGWSFEGRAARYDGQRVAVAPSRVPLLKLLVEADAPLLAREIRDRLFDKQTTEGNVRYHIDKLREDLRAAFPSFEGEIVTNDNGYSLALR